MKKRYIIAVNSNSSDIEFKTGKEISTFMFDIDSGRKYNTIKEAEKRLVEKIKTIKGKRKFYYTIIPIYTK